MSSSAASKANGGAKRPILDLIARHNHFALTALVMAVISLMVLPLPTLLLDTLIAINISISLALLMLSMYVPSALGLSTFPSLLLFTTMFRLSLNIAATKQILLHAHAGHIVETFGKLVVGGNVVVGLVVFLIIAIVQFIVIAKGAERVAEVGARFTLDAMPGKQMSIDADLRAGIIDKDEAKRRRSTLEQESQMHGAMDGAMKFVKGDAIAAIIIALVNIIGGIAIGAGMNGMTIGNAVSTYTILTVGEGMVSQIPSLFVSIAAGIIITRVAGGEESETHLGRQISQQIIAHPTALMSCGVILGGFVLVPGFPRIQFLLLAILFAGGGYWLAMDRKRAKSFEESAVKAMRRDGVNKVPLLIDETPSTLAVPLRIRLSPTLRERFSPEVLDQSLEKRKLEVQRELGLPFPGVKMNYDATLPDFGYAIDVQELCVDKGVLKLDHLVILGTKVTEAQSVAGAIEAQASSALGKAIWIPKAAIHESLQSIAIVPEDMLAMHLGAILRRHADAFVGIQEVQSLISRVETQIPDLAAEILRALPLQRIADVLRRLVQEGVSIRYLREIFESLIVWGVKEKDIVALTEYVRVDLGRFITHKLLDESHTLRAVTFDGDVEAMFRDSIQQGVGGSYLAMSPDISSSIFSEAEKILSGVQNGGRLVLLVSTDIRRFAKKFLSTRFPDLVVVSYQELPPDAKIESIGMISANQMFMRDAA
jgi:type III secretion protein V